MTKPLMIIINSNYPNEGNRYGDVFVHSRLKHYVRSLNVKVVGWKNNITDHSFEYEGIQVEMVNSKDKLVSKVLSYHAHIIGFHFIEGWMHQKILRRFGGPVCIWIHGTEALSWHRRLFQLNMKTIFPFLRYVGANIVQMMWMHKIVSYANKSNKIKLVFVSRWMKAIAEKDTFSKVEDPTFIPNPIDSECFRYHKKTLDDRKKILLIRSFSSKKYANDIAVDAILMLSKRPIFRDLSFTIYGVGKYFSPLTDKLKQFSNISLNNFFLENKAIPAVHKEHGIFLCPTRQDAQGVSMCEAMSSGLVPISSLSTAIPEFVEHGVSGYMSRSAQEIADIIEYLYHNPAKFIQVSEAAARGIRVISSTDVVVKKELTMITDLLAPNGTQTSYD